MRGYPDDLVGLEVEFVQVVGRRRGRVLKNAVDVRMAVDALALVNAMPCIDVYVLVTGDRDFVQVVQALHREGKRVVGVAPEDGASAELAAMCDRFVYYEAIAWRAGPRPEAAGGSAVRWVLGFLRGTRGSGRRHGIGGSPGRGNGGDCGHAPPADAAGGPRGKGWDWFDWARERIGSGAVAANAEGSWCCFPRSLTTGFPLYSWSISAGFPTLFDHWRGWRLEVAATAWPVAQNGGSSSSRWSG